MDVPRRVFPNFSTRRLDEILGQILGAGKATRKAYSYTVTETQGPRNEEVRHLRRSYINKWSLFLLLMPFFVGVCVNSVFAQTAQESQSILYVPLIGITSVPQPLALPKGAGNVTYNYAVKNFLGEVSLANVSVVDDTCSPVKFIEGDDNSDSKLDHSETWRYTCTTKISTTTESTATARGTANGMSAMHNAYATVVVGSNVLPPLVSIINITKVAYPLSLPIGGGSITFTYKVNNPGMAPLSGVVVTDNKCNAMSGKLGDTNGNELLDINEVWIYTCTTTLKQTTSNTVHVTAFANGLRAVGDATITVRVDIPDLSNAGAKPNVKNIVWGSLSGVLGVLVLAFVFVRKSKSRKLKRTLNSRR